MCAISVHLLYPRESAAVYLADDLKHHRKVAVKVLRPELAAIIGAERFLKEIEVTDNLQHPTSCRCSTRGKPSRFFITSSRMRQLDLYSRDMYSAYMEVHMELSKKTTILLTPELHGRLTRLAQQRGSSLGALVREACERQYGLVSAEARLSAVRELARLDLPVAGVRQIERESVPQVDELLP